MKTNGTDKTKTVRRVFLIVLDGCGAGEAPDAHLFGDRGAHTLKSAFSTGKLHIPHLLSLGLGHIEGLSFLPKADAPAALYGRMRELAGGKDTTVGHWELSGVTRCEPLPTFPHGFPPAVIQKIEKISSRAVLCNRPYSGTRVIADYGEEHLKTGALIVYTSADSVCQIAAHEDVVPPKELYRICREVRAFLQGDLGVGRVIARPFEGAAPNFRRTERRRDFSVEPPEETVLDALKKAGRDVIAVGKIEDIFAGRGMTDILHTTNDTDAMQAVLDQADTDFQGLLFANLSDFDMLYGHRRDALGFAENLCRFDATLGRLLAKLSEDDLLIVTADHGTDPAFEKSTDHTREYVPLLLYRRGVTPVGVGTLDGFAHVAKTAADVLGIDYPVKDAAVASLAPLLSR